MKLMDRPVYPLPEVVDAGRAKRWEIEPTGPVSPRVELSQGLMFVPLDASAHSRFVRNHELGHVRWSPKRPDAMARRYKIAGDVLAAVEDMRMNTKMEQAGIDVSSGGWPKTVITALAKDVLARGSQRLAVLMMVAAQASGQTERAFTEVFAEDPVGAQAIELATLARKALWAVPCPRFRDTVRVAKWLQMILDGAESGKPLPKGLGMGGSPGGLSEGLKIARNYGPTVRGTRKVPWGKMNIEKLPRPYRVRGFLGRHNSATEEGTNPRFLHRLLVDGRVFRRVRRDLGGTVLIDASGSMQLESKDLKEILESAPGCTVGVYSGNTMDGVLRILAQDGRQVEERWIAAPAGGANVIDGPALEWLSKQPKPRIWVSDGQVTGKQDRSGALNVLECLCLIRRHQILQKDKIADAVQLFGRMRAK
jgi:hypothetical protein